MTPQLSLMRWFWHLEVFMRRNCICMDGVWLLVEASVEVWRMAWIGIGVLWTWGRYGEYIVHE